MNPNSGPCAIEEVIVSPAPSPVQNATNGMRASLLALSATLARSPERGTQRLVEEAMRTTGADSAGITLEDAEKPDEIFRWVAVCGEFSRYLNGTMPRHFSPCGEVLRRKHTLVMKDPVRYYPYIVQLHAPIRSALLVPFARRGRLVGTLWALAH